jgi:hypothetical protein
LVVFVEDYAGAPALNGIDVLNLDIPGKQAIAFALESFNQAVETSRRSLAT